MNVTILCDASYCPQYRVAGYGFWIACQRKRFGGGGAIKSSVDGTNTAEMMAICNAIWHGVGQKAIEKGDSLLIQSDSLAAIDRLDEKKVVSVTEQQQEVITYFREIILKMDFSVKFRHVKGHTAHQEARFVANRMCDKRAKFHMRAARKQLVAKPYIEEIKELLREHQP